MLLNSFDTSAKQTALVFRSQKSDIREQIDQTPFKLQKLFVIQTWLTAIKNYF